jgi:hypothetical protein
VREKWLILAVYRNINIQEYKYTEV